MPFFPSHRRRKRWLLPLTAAFVIAAISLVALRHFERSSLASDAERAATQLHLHGEALQALIERHRVLPAVLALDPDVRTALARATMDSTELDRLNRKLERVNGVAATSTLTLLDRNGVAVAASNWRMPRSNNVGNDYQFRPYFRQAMQQGSGTFYAEGVTTAMPGYFLSEAVRDERGNPVGVVVVKVILRPLEQTWADTTDTVFVSDSNGVIFLSSHRPWRYLTLHGLADSVREELLRSRQ